MAVLSLRVEICAFANHESCCWSTGGDTSPSKLARGVLVAAGDGAALVAALGMHEPAAELACPYDVSCYTAVVHKKMNARSTNYHVEILSLQSMFQPKPFD